MSVTTIAINDVLRVTYYCRLAGQVIETVLHQRCTVAPTGGTGIQQIQDVVDTLKVPGTNPFLAAYQAATCTSFNFDYVRVQKIAAQKQIYFQGVIGVLGGQSEIAISPNSALSITKRTGTYGRTGVGRMQLTAFPYDAVQNGVVQTGFVSFVDAIAATLKGSATPGALYLGSYNMCLPEARIQVGTPYDVIAVTTNLQVRTMHRRTVGLGI